MIEEMYRTFNISLKNFQYIISSGIFSNFRDCISHSEIKHETLEFSEAISSLVKHQLANVIFHTIYLKVRFNNEINANF